MIQLLRRLILLLRLRKKIINTSVPEWIETSTIILIERDKRYSASTGKTLKGATVIIDYLVTRKEYEEILRDLYPLKLYLVIRKISKKEYKKEELGT